jgi:hypothetical protein
MAEGYFGIYAGVVTANGGGEGVLEVQVPALFPGGEKVVARPALAYGVLFLPENGSKVWVQFEGGEPTLPVWTGVHQRDKEWDTTPAPPAARVLRSLSDQRVVLDDTSGSEGIAILHGGKAHAIRLTDTGVTVEHDAGHALTLESSAVTITVGQATVTVESGKATISLGAASIEVGASGVTVTGPLVKHGGATAPVVRAGVDQGIGNLGAPVIMLPGQFTVLA